MAGAARAQHKTSIQIAAQAGAAQVVQFWWLSVQFPPSFQQTGEAGLQRRTTHTRRKSTSLQERWPKTA
jgi:hypothetical protein